LRQVTRGAFASAYVLRYTLRKNKITERRLLVIELRSAFADVISRLRHATIKGIEVVPDSAVFTLCAVAGGITIGGKVIAANGIGCKTHHHRDQETGRIPHGYFPQINIGSLA
jgi:hypothetical protein